MHFDLLEQLLARRSSAERLALNYLGHERDPLYKTFLAFAAQHDPRDTHRINALVITVAVISELSRPDGLDPRKLTEVFVRFLLDIPVVSRDSAILKSDRSSTVVVSVADMEEAFESTSVDNLYRVTRDLLGIMDNRQYFFEILTAVALQRSDTSMTYMQSAWSAVDILGWNNHFTPFIILQALDVLFLDKTRIPITGYKPCDTNTFLAIEDRVASIHTLYLFSALFALFQRTRLLQKRILPIIAHRLNELSDANDWSVTSWSDWVRVRSITGELADFPELTARTTKINFNF